MTSSLEDPAAEPASAFDLPALVRRLHEAYEAGQPLEAGLARPAGWGDAVQALIASGQFEVARHALPALQAAFAGHGYFQSAGRLMDLIPASDGSIFIDDREAGCQLVPHHGADTLLFAFTAGGRLGLPVAAVHRFLRGLGVHLAYLRDPGARMYMRGVRDLAPTYAGSLEAMRGIARELGVRRILSLGLSNSGYAALRYGLDLKAEAAIAFSPTTFVPPQRLEPSAVELRKRGVADITARELAELDLAPRIVEAGGATRLRIVFAEQNPADRLQAEHVEGLPGVTLERLPAASHNALYTSVMSGRFPAQLGWLTGEDESAGR